MRHLTLRALAMLTTGCLDSADLQAAYHLACTATPAGTGDSCFTALDVEHFHAGRSRNLPDCPKCLVRWDQALEECARRKQKELDRSEWLRKDEDDNEAFWQTLNTGHKYKRSDR